jgi:hypothetical protein
VIEIESALFSMGPLWKIAGVVMVINAGLAEILIS